MIKVSDLLVRNASEVINSPEFCKLGTVLAHIPVTFTDNTHTHMYRFVMLVH
jgi:hypothetical protein